jgi:hypothetical protein
MLDGEMLLWMILPLWIRSIIIINDDASFARFKEEARIFSSLGMVIWLSIRIHWFPTASDTQELVFQNFFTNSPFYHNVYASIIREWIAQNLITLGCEIGHTNASTNHSTRFSFRVAALDFFPTNQQ